MFLVFISLVSIAFAFDKNYDGVDILPRDPTASTSYTGYFLKSAQQSGAVCLDGSAPLYYFRAGTQTTAWYIHHQGGGWCSGVETSPAPSSTDSCYHRSKNDLGSTTKDPPTRNIDGGYFSSDPKVNPLMYTWNSVFIRYCDGASFSGNNMSTDTYNGTTLHYRGARILEAVFDDLWTNRGLRMAKDVVISGCSAGGLATYLHVDYWAQRLASTGAKVMGLPDSGFFINWEGNGKYLTGLKHVYFQQNSTSGVNQACVQAHRATKDEWMCIFAQETSKFIKTPIFAMQSRFDAWQIGHELIKNDNASVNLYGETLTNYFLQDFLADSVHGAFFDSCEHHCGSWDSIVINGKNIGEAMKDFYLGVGNTRVYFQNKAFPCTACCHPNM